MSDYEANQLLSMYFKSKKQGYSDKEAEAYAFMYVYGYVPK